MARALIVGCGCRGRELGSTLLADGWVVRGTCRGETSLAEIDASGIEPVQADPDRVGELLDHVGDVALVFWLLGTASGDAAAVAELHGARLERLLEELVDTPVRGFVYEAAGSVDGAILQRGREIVERASSTWRIPAEVVAADPADRAAWPAAMRAATARLVAG